MSDVVLFEERALADGRRMGLVTLNSEKTLNSLSVEMVDVLRPQLQGWEQDDAIVCVFLQGAGEKAFCAGGDIRRLYETMRACGSDKPNAYAEAFFENEYRLDYLIHKYRKPLIVWGHGIVMGGGIGLMSGASHRVVTEGSRLAMPEINIGLYPDVGGTRFLNRTPGRTGLFLGLTGASMNAGDALFTGLADFFIPHGRKDRVMERLSNSRWDGDLAADSKRVSELMGELESPETLPASNVRIHYDLIEQVTGQDSVAAVAEAILAIQSDDKWLVKAVQALKKGCPVTAHLVYEQIKRGVNLSLEQVFQMELIMSLQCSRHPDFPEGVRALLIDRDGNPHWQHRSIAEVPREWVEAHFKAPWGERAANPLADLGKNR